MDNNSTLDNKGNSSDTLETKIALFAGGCFWCVEASFEKVKGVSKAISGYAGDSRETADYQTVCSGTTSHREVVEVHYNPSVISFKFLVKEFLKMYDPTDDGGSFGDRGHQYTSAIFYKNEEEKSDAESAIAEVDKSGVYKKPIVTPVLPIEMFYEAEEYHQDYYLKNPAHYQSYYKGSGRKDFIKKHWLSGNNKTYKKPDEQSLKIKLTPLQFSVTQEDGTEPPFKNEYWDNKGKGIYVDVVSGEPLFASTDKFKSGTGWPSFTRPLMPENIVENSDKKFGMSRTEVRSKHADSHLGHLFPDGPAPTGLRYCINSASLRFIPFDELEREGYAEFKSRIK